MGSVGRRRLVERCNPWPCLWVRCGGPGELGEGWYPGPGCCGEQSSPPLERGSAELPVHRSAGDWVTLGLAVREELKWGELEALGAGRARLEPAEGIAENS